jgi:hypothetical protein
MTSMPANTDSLASRKSGYIRANLINFSCNFMTRDARIRDPWISSLFDECIAMTYTAGIDRNSYFPCAWVRDITFDKFELSTRF